MDVKVGTSIKDIEKQIKAIEDELRRNKHLSEVDRICLHDELDYLRSFLPKEF